MSCYCFCRCDCRPDRYLFPPLQVEKTEDGETSFCVQAVPAPFAAGADLDKEAVSHADAEPQPQYLVSDLATYQLSAAGDVYKLVVREEKEPHADDPELHPYSQVQLTADQLTDASVAAPVAGSVLARTPTPPPAPLPPPLPPQHCLVCDLSLFNYRALGIFGHTTHQTSTTYAVKLRQVTGHRSNFVYHSEVICESCASLLNVVDSFESRLREIKARLEYTRAEVAEKFVRTCSRYDTLSLNRAESAEAEGGIISGEKADVEIHTRGAGKGKKRLAVAEEAAFEPPVKKKARTKTTPEKDVSYEKTKSIDSSNEGELFSDFSDCNILRMFEEYLAALWNLVIWFLKGMRYFGPIPNRVVLGVIFINNGKVENF